MPQNLQATRGGEKKREEKDTLALRIRDEQENEAEEI